MDKIASRSNPKIMKLDTPQFRSILTPELQILFNLFKKCGYELRIAGGAVRDILSGLSPNDIDFATTATPSEMKVIFRRENIYMFNKNGEKHGTISIRINDKENFEISTLKVNVKAGDRHAGVEFAEKWILDANERDFTINSMYMDMKGVVYDYFYGYDDLKNKKILFINDPEKRIKEDYSRIMRYFRFYGRIADKPDNHDSKIIEAIKNNKHGLDQIPGKRIWMELSKILVENYGGELIIKMIEIGLGPHIGLPNDPNVENFNKTWNRCKDLWLKPTSLLSALFRTLEDVYNCKKRLEWPAFDKDLAYFVTGFRDDFAATEKPLKQCLAYMVRYKVPCIKEYVRELIKYHGNVNLLEEFENTSIPHFPVYKRLLLEHGIPPNRELSLIFEFLTEQWIESNFKLTQDELEKMIPNAKDNLIEYQKNKSTFPRYRVPK